MKIVIKINDTEVAISYDEARRIYNELDRVFGNQNNSPQPIWPSIPSIPTMPPPNSPPFPVPPKWPSYPPFPPVTCYGVNDASAK